jgi:hypothetical protein
MNVPHVYQRVIELGPQLELRLQRGSGPVERHRLREHFTIGRSAACDLAIDNPGVNLIHARVVPGIGGRFELRCVGGARLTLKNDTTTDTLTLKIGTTFRIGQTTLECTRIDAPDYTSTDGIAVSTMNSWTPSLPTSPSPTPQASATDTTSADLLTDPPATVEMPRLIICPACFKDMTAVPVAARFCPKCGVQLPSRDAAGFLIPPEESSPLYPVYQSLRDELEGKLADESPQVASSMIILAYANAMLNLGWKYEHGRGLLRNVEEASRCYAKAGRLSQAWGK